MITRLFFALPKCQGNDPVALDLKGGLEIGNRIEPERMLSLIREPKWSSLRPLGVSSLSRRDIVVLQSACEG